MRTLLIYVGLIALMFLSQCTTFRMLTHLNSSPRERYLRALTNTELSNSQMVRSWIKAGDVSLHDSLSVILPYQETGYFPATETQARFYRVELVKGQILKIAIHAKSKNKGRLFADVYAYQQNQWNALASADSSLNMSVEMDRNRSCLIRIQPELLTGVYYSISITASGSLLIPVKGATNKSIGSFYDDMRGTRKHEGLDIFAPKGTFVIAPTGGMITRVGTNTLGGKVVWMEDPIRGQSYYFAHLDSQIAKPGTTVRRGDVLGTVGNTGNAKFTPSHLHFGVYQNGSKDPIGYFRNTDKGLADLLPDTNFRQEIFRVASKDVRLHASATEKVKDGQPLVKDDYVKVIARHGTWYRALTADGQEGFIEKNKIKSAAHGNQIILKHRTQLLASADHDAVPEGEVTGRVESLANYKSFRFVTTESGATGWIDLEKIDQKK